MWMIREGKIPTYGFGEVIGIIVAKIWYPALIHGHHNFASTYEFPVRIKLIDNWYYPLAKADDLPEWNLPEWIRAAKELEEEGVAAITTFCGLTGSIQEELSDEVEIPVFTSNLLQVPFVSKIIGKRKRVGILTHSAARLTSKDSITLRKCGIDESIPISIKGMYESSYADIWKSQFSLNPSEKYNPSKFDRSMVEGALVKAAQELITENPDIGAIVLECTEMPLYSSALRRATGLLVFDSAALVRYIYSAIRQVA
jgi:hypothetical protein